jgi:AbrB family looped-hinge helix DNA binding protein
METTRVSTKGQIVLPKAIREDYDWPAGTDLAIERGPDSVTLRRNPTIRPTTVEEVAGCLKYDGPPLSIEDMQRAIDEELKERWLRKSR